MKKLFVSCPTTGRNMEDVFKTVKKMHGIAEVIFEQELEVIDHILVTEFEKFDLHDMARHIEAMAQADYFIGIEGYWSGVLNTENELPKIFDIPHTFIHADVVMDDFEEWAKQYRPTIILDRPSEEVKEEVSEAE